MGNTFQPNEGSFAPTTFIWDIAILQDIDVNTPEFKELLVRLYQNLNVMAELLNAKTTGYYDTIEYVTGNQYFQLSDATAVQNDQPYRPSYSLTVNFGALPNAATKSVPHGLDMVAGTLFVKVYGAATDPTVPKGLPLPYSSATDVAHNIELFADNTNITIITGADYSMYTGIITIEYLKF